MNAPVAAIAFGSLAMTPLLAAWLVMWLGVPDRRQVAFRRWLRRVLGIFYALVAGVTALLLIHIASGGEPEELFWEAMTVPGLGPVVAVIIALRFWAIRRTHPSNHCRFCGYPITTRSPRCSECGAERAKRS